MEGYTESKDHLSIKITFGWPRVVALGRFHCINKCSLNRNMRYSARIVGILKLQVAIFPITAIYTRYVAIRATGNDVTHA